MHSKRPKSAKSTAGLDGSVSDHWLPVESNSIDNEQSGIVAPDVVVHDDLLPVEQSNTYTQFVVDGDLSKYRKLLFKLELVVLTAFGKGKAALIREQEQGLEFLLFPIYFGIGCIIYFNLPREPLLGAFLTVAVVAHLVSRRCRSGHFLKALFVGLTIISAGAAAAQIQTYLKATKSLPTSLFAEVSGVIEKVEMRANGSIRYTIDTTGRNGSVRVRNQNYDVDRIRLTARKGGPTFQLSQTISGRARVGPASGPAYPGSYDFGFQNWFNGIGGSGFFLGRPKLASVQVEASFSLRGTIAHIRDNVGNLIRSALPGDGGGLAAALIVGERSGISENVAEDLRKSGLAHILAISGLHMALISATVIFMVRGGLAFFPNSALNRPVKKWASGAALCVSAVYLLLSGAGVSTQRAFIMISIMLIAVLFDRRALTMRNVAIAALIVLVLSPHAILSPGFQMSFSAVAALISSYELLKRRREKIQTKFDRKKPSRVKKWIFRDIGGLALTSLIAGTATGLYAAYHFQRVATLGLVANVLAMPFVSILVMPLALLSVVAMPFGLESWPLEWMSMAIQPVTSIANWVANLGYIGNTGALSTTTLLLGSLTIVFLTVFQTNLRYLGLLAIPWAVFSTVSAPKPDILLLENAQQLAVFDASGEMQVLRPNAEKFNVEIWRRAYSPDIDATYFPKRPTLNPYYKCDSYGCSAVVKGMVVTRITSTTQLQRDCRNADILIIPFVVSNPCAYLPAPNRPLVVDMNALQQDGAHAFYINENALTGESSIEIKTSYVQSDRIWRSHR